MKRPFEVIEISEDENTSEENMKKAAKKAVKKATTNPLMKMMAASKELKQAECVGVKGLYQFKDFVTQREADNLIAEIEAWTDCSWKKSTFNSHRYLVKNYGLVTLYAERATRLPDTSKGEHKTPHFLKPVIEKITDKKQPWAQLLPQDWVPNEGNINTYEKMRNDFLPSHFDDRALSGPVLAVLTLSGSATVTFKQFRSGTTQPQIDAGRVEAQLEKRVFFPNHCLQLVTGNSRYNFTHGIDTEDLSDEKRVCIVFRMSKAPQ
eukprot:TRINITY_DN1746_c0_g1_i4.p1 TRINITY_DN1746_c0_g1~~TRINITY_DN1746_c0_g1_i4.p1  ORF type:complete len:264 (+),score=53.09 TRINITY_DN1746_c0_g1_i4:145-936(+)